MDGGKGEVSLVSWFRLLYTLMDNGLAIRFILGDLDQWSAEREGYRLPTVWWPLGVSEEEGRLEALEGECVSPSCPLKGQRHSGS